MAHFLIQTRQKAAKLFPVDPQPASVDPDSEESSHPSNPAFVENPLEPLGGNEDLNQGPVEVDGYAIIAVLAISDQPFTITFSESIVPGGPFGVSQVYASVVLDGRYVVAQRFSPVGSFMRMDLLNDSASPQTYLNLLVQGVPCP